MSAGFDVCDDAAGIVVNHAKREVRITLPPPRILSIDILRFETINEESGFLNAISPEDRNRWYGEARAALERGALAQGALERARAHARELFAGVRGARTATRWFSAACRCAERGPCARRGRRLDAREGSLAR